MPKLPATSTCLDECDLSWTTGMPVHPEPAPGLNSSSLPRKDLREMVVLVAVCVISTVVFVPPLAGVTRPAPRQPVLAARDVRVEAPLAPAVPARAPVPAVTAAATAMPVTRVATRTPAVPLVPNQLRATTVSVTDPQQASEVRASHVPGASPLTRHETPRGTERRALAAKLGRALAGDGRHRVQPFPRPAEF